VKIRPGQPDWSAVEPYLNQALDLPCAEREAYLSRLQSEQPHIAAELRDLLAERDVLEANGFLEASAAHHVERGRVGSQIGAYTIRSLIGRGGMGEVWLAVRTDGRFEGQVAVKFLDSYSASPAALDRFRREGRLLARVAHRNIARLLDAGATPDDRPYLVLEYVDGKPIDAFCEAQSLSVEARILLLMQVLEALAHAHSNLIVHRDIKPSNILVTASGEAKLLDFGIAKLLGAEASSERESALTRIEESALTPDYAAPEQILGEPVSTATDVYQVGVLMFALLAGKLPLGPSDSTRAERIRSALDREPMRLSDVCAPQLRKALRGDLDAIVSKALRKLPAERYATAAAFAEDLSRHLSNEPIAAGTNLLGYRIGKFVRRHRTAVIASSVAIIALICTTGFALLQMREAQIQRDHSREQAKRAELQAEFVTLMMSTVGNKPTTAEQLLDAGLRLLKEHYTSDPRFRASALLNLSARYSDLGITSKQYALLQEVADIGRKMNDSSLVARSECGLAEAEIDLGHLQRAVERSSAGSAALARTPNPDPLFVEDCMEAQADVEDAQGNPAAALPIAENALLLLERAGATRDLRYSALLGRISDYYKEIGDQHKGFEYVQRELAAAESAGLGDTDFAMTAIHNVASTLMGFGEVNAACAREKDVILRLQSTDRTIITAMAVLYGTCFLRTGQPVEALAWFDKGLSAAQNEDDVALQIHARWHRARALIALMRYAEAGSELDRVEGIARDHSLSDSLSAARARLVRVEWLLTQGRPQEALSVLDPVLRVARDAKAGKGSVLPAALLWAARIALAQGRYLDAMNAAGEALKADQQRARKPADSADVGEALLWLAKARGALNDHSGMQDAARDAAISLTASLGADNPLTGDALLLASGQASRADLAVQK
jgi:eukaryotic-like serine/threonine-protein kinase